ncbi:hypothetical protein KS4_18080 [Poriferisphaera corsica]|uniref:Tail tape measure protein n=1 Tax=Poriferisphaera corsica TaxID=2528020 RepID=A0A517YU53_9BACT|nr:hypothetical protein [Poriferisphaera corsica]QDU33751.1 hypothetical protein KS4_18080 [Poriferisphaera corsica]
MAGGRTTYYINGDDKGFTKAVDRSRKKAEGFGGSMKRMGGKFKAVAGGPLKLAAVGIAAVGAAGFAAVAGLGALASAQAGVIDRMSKMSDTVGVSTEFYSAINRQASEAGVETGKLEGAMKKFAISMGDMPRKAAEFEKLGLSISSLEQMNPEEQYRAVTTAIDEMGSAAEQAAVANKLFGGAGVEMLRMFRQGEGSIDAYIEKQEILGESFTRLAGAQVEGMNDSLDTLKAAFSGVGKQIAIKVAPYVTYLADEVVRFITESGGIKTIVGKGFEYVGKTISGVTRVVDVLRGAFYGVRAVVFSVIGYGLKGIVWLQEKIFSFTRKVIEPLLNKLGGFLGLDGVGDIFGDVADKTFDAVNIFADDLVSIASDAGKKSSDSFSSAWNGRTFDELSVKAIEIEESSIKAAQATVENAEKMAKFQKEAQKSSQKITDESSKQTKELDKQIEKSEKKRYASIMGFGANARLQASQRLDIVNQTKKDQAAEETKKLHDTVGKLARKVEAAFGVDPSELDLA